MVDFNPEQALELYSKLSREQDELFFRLMELEREAKRNGYLLTVANDSAWRGEDTCAIRAMTIEESHRFLAQEQEATQEQRKGLQA